MSANGHLKFQGTNRATFVGTTSNIMFDTTSTSLGIGVTGTDHPSSNLYITGNAYVTSDIGVGGVLTMGTVNVVARHDLEAVTGTGNTTPLTVEFTNPTTSLVASGNVEVGGNVVAGYLYGDGRNITGISSASNLQVVTDTGNVTSNTIQFSNATTSLTATSNIEVAGFVGSSGTGALTVPSGTTAQQPSTGLVGGMIRFNSTVNRLEVYNGTTWQGLGSVSGDGGDQSVYNHDGYRVHTFLADGTFTLYGTGLVDFIIIAGGGGGGGSYEGGGGGAGGVIRTLNSMQVAGSYSVTIGAGGTGMVGGVSSGTNGGDSYIERNGIKWATAKGGGRGAGHAPSTSAGNGGSGGGGTHTQVTAGTGISSTGTNTQTWGNSGGTGTNSWLFGAGGGGAGQTGSNAAVDRSGEGGNGIGGSSFRWWDAGTSAQYAGGGGGGARTGWARTGKYGGGNGGSNANGSNATFSTTVPYNGKGSGGGGGATSSGGGIGGNGADGMVVIRYLL